jgi:hypothetical protein
MRHNNVGSINAAVVSCNNVNLYYLCQLTAYKYVWHWSMVFLHSWYGLQLVYANIQ